MTTPRRPAPRPAPQPAVPPPAAAARAAPRPAPRPVRPEPEPPSKAPKQPKQQKAAKPPKQRRARRSLTLPALRRPARSRQQPPATETELDDAESAPRSRAQRLHAERTARRVRLRRILEIVGAVLAIVVIVSLALAFSGGSGERKTVVHPTAHPTVTGANLRDPELATTFLGSASSDIAAITTYDYRSLDEALTAGLAVTTGKYREQYRLALTGDLARTAAEEHVVHTFEVLDVGVGAMTADGTQAKVLVFGRERITDDRTGPDGEVSPITLCATIRRLGNRYLISDLTQDTDPGLPPGGPDLATAVNAARTEVVNLLSFRRAEFPADLQRALDGATVPLRDALESGSDDARATLEDGKYDTSGTVSATAVVRADADTVSLLILAQETRTVDDVSEPTVLNHRYEVTVTRTASGWAASRVASVDGAV